MTEEHYPPGYTEEEQREHRKQWVAALRGGKYKQTTGRLRRNEGLLHGFCCLGVACDISQLSEWDTDRYLCSGDMLPESVRRWVGLGRDCEDHLIAMNDDDHKGFEEIADYIEKELL